MVVFGRGPYFTKAAFRYESLVAHGIPESVSDSASVGASVENGAHNFHFARPRITMLAHVAVEAQGTVVFALTHALLLQEVHGKNRGVSAVAATKGECAIF